MEKLKKYMDNFNILPAIQSELEFYVDKKIYTEEEVIAHLENVNS